MFQKIKYKYKSKQFTVLYKNPSSVPYSFNNRICYMLKRLLLHSFSYLLALSALNFILGSTGAPSHFLCTACFFTLCVFLKLFLLPGVPSPFSLPGQLQYSIDKVYSRNISWTPSPEKSSSSVLPPHPMITSMSTIGHSLIY